MTIQSLIPPLEQAEKNANAVKRKRIIMLAGPTATGKTELSLDLAGMIGAEIVSADSAQVYRGMDIGTAKATQKERSLVPHHLIDVRDLDEPFNVADFYGHCQQSFREIFNKESVPIVVGGSGFYVRTLLYGPPTAPPSQPDVRDRLDAQMREMGPEVLFERLQILDPIYAATISENDRHKIVRALEIIALTDCKVSDFAKPSKETEQEYDFRCWFVYYPREVLYKRIEERCEVMLKNGFLQEVEELERKGIRLNSSASQAIGYRQALHYLQSPKSTADYLAFIADFKQASRQYAKRQFTWFRKEPHFRWINLEEYSKEQIREMILQDFEQGS